MKFNWDVTENLLGVRDLACVWVTSPYTGVLGRWYCPAAHRDALYSRVSLWAKGSEYSFLEVYCD